MDSKIFFLTFCVILAVITFQPTNAEDYDPYIAYKSELDGKLTIDEKVAYLTFDLKKSTAIMRVLREFLAENPTGITAAQKTALNKLNFNLCQTAITSLVENLVSAMNVETRPLPADTITTVHDLITSIIYSNHRDIAYKIFEAIIDKMLRSMGPLQVSEILRSSEAKDNKIDVFLFNIQMYLFNKYGPYYRGNGEYVLYFVYYLYEIRTLQIVNLPFDGIDNLNRAIETLPSTLKSLYFSKGVCFKNSENDEYLYEDTALNRSRRYVYTRQSDSSITTSGIFTTSFSISMATIESTLRNKLYKHYVYRGNDDIIYANTSPNRVPTNSLWSLSLNVDKIRFHQGDYYLCGSEKLRNGNRRYVEAEKYLSAWVPRLCEWYVDDCQNIN